MTNKGKTYLRGGLFLITLFLVWTASVLLIDVQSAGQTETEIGFSNLNTCFHRLTGVHMQLYTITDFMGLVPIAVCAAFAFTGLLQACGRKSLLKVDGDILLLGLYYLFVIIVYLVFEMYPVNFRPILIDGRAEASYPSSTTLLVISVMPTLVFQIRRRSESIIIKTTVCSLTELFILFTVGGRLISGVHWLTDIIGSVLLGSGLFCIYKALVIQYCGD